MRPTDNESAGLTEGWNAGNEYTKLGMQIVKDLYDIRRNHVKDGELRDEELQETIEELYDFFCSFFLNEEDVIKEADRYRIWWKTFPVTLTGHSTISSEIVIQKMWDFKRYAQSKLKEKGVFMPDVQDPEFAMI